MKKILLYMLFGTLVATWSTGCDDAESPVLPNAIYLVEADTRDSYDCIATRIADRQISVTLRMTHQVDHPVTVALEVDEEALAQHNAKFDEALQMLPIEKWVLINSDGTPLAGKRVEVTMPAGRTTATFPIQLSSVDSDDPNQYALTLTVKEVSDDIQLLEKQKTVLFMFQQDFETPVIFLNPFSTLHQEWTDFPATNAWTVEFHFTFDRTVADNIYGQVLTFFGNEGAEGLYVRPYKDSDGMDIHLFGTFGVASFNVSDQKWWSDAKYQGRWHHFAYVCENGVCSSYLDGQLMATSVSAGWTVPVKWISVTFSDQNHTAKMGFSEYRVWSVARTLEDINRNKYNVNPHAKGLFAYWKLNDQSDNLIVDCTGNGHDFDTSDKSKTGFNQYTWGVARNDETLTSLTTVSGM